MRKTIDITFFRSLAGEKWKFQLYDHVVPDQTEVKTRLNQTQTIIEVCLHKQTHTTWPQLYSRLSTPITPEHKDVSDNLIDQQIYSSIEDEKIYEIPIKKILSNFSETIDGKAIVQLILQETRDCRVQFTETNFTVIFYSKFEDFPPKDFHFFACLSSNAEFLRFHAITSQTLVKIFARVKERINPNRCFHQVTEPHVEVTLIKENENAPRWNRLEPDEYTKPPAYQSITTSTSSIINNNSSMSHLNRGRI